MSMWVTCKYVLMHTLLSCSTYLYIDLKTLILDVRLINVGLAVSCMITMPTYFPHFSGCNKAMLNCCGFLSWHLKLNFSYSQCMCIAFRPKLTHQLALLYLNNQLIGWSSKFEFFIFILADVWLSCNINIVVYTVHETGNCIFSNLKFFDELLECYLLNFYNYFLFQCSMTAIILTLGQPNALNYTGIIFIVDCFSINKGIWL